VIYYQCEETLEKRGDFNNLEMFGKKTVSESAAMLQGRFIIAVMSGKWCCNHSLVYSKSSSQHCSELTPCVTWKWSQTKPSRGEVTLSSLAALFHF